MGLKKNNPGCNCCETCDILSDDFNRSNDTDIGSNWTEVSGSWSIASNALAITGTTSAVVISTFEASQPEVQIDVKIKVTNHVALTRIIFNYTDTNNYHFVQFRLGGAGHIKIFSRVSGSDTELATLDEVVTTANAFYPARICVSQLGYCTAQLALEVGGDPATSVARLSAPVTVTETVFGLGTGTTATGTISFDEFVASNIKDGCPLCVGACHGCPDDVGPGFWKVSINGFENGDCSECEDLDGDYFLPFHGTSDVGRDGCDYRLTITPLCVGVSPHLGYNMLRIIICDEGPAAGCGFNAGAGPCVQFSISHREGGSVDFFHWAKQLEEGEPSINCEESHTLDLDIASASPDCEAPDTVDIEPA